MHSILIEESKWQQTGFFFYASMLSYILSFTTFTIAVLTSDGI